MNAISRTGLLAGLALVVTACGGGGGGGGGQSPSDNGNTPVAKNCLISESDQVNWTALAGEPQPKLSDYNLFASSCDPTRDAHGGMPYDLNTPLFSDYASKYRFVFVPEGKTIGYDDKYALDFPVGTVIVKTFAMPRDTSYRGYNPDNNTERLLETRLLIRHSDGWMAYPYLWNADETEATYQPQGKLIDLSLVHNGKQQDFTYAVPDKNQCKQCHSTEIDDVNVFTPIGPKARTLNGDYDYGNGPVNQLQHWQQAGILSGLPSLDQVPKVPSYHDADAANLDGYSNAQLMKLAKGYLDINCSHCHGDGGEAAYTGLKLEYWRPFDEDAGEGAGYAHGVCKKPIAYSNETLNYDVVPGKPGESILHFRMDTNDNRASMPRLGRSIIHEEGVALIEAWINSLPDASCSGAASP